ncbi:DUF1648 domain-containing protein [Leucobacter sp. CSA1]|uniref:DUF1648 domain-containing protein n=1 Tax=Leucobacter chromiisoli TaxID=2796471 RepID=A0A934UV75_9MICO|nr:DUF1648 domain-containing protein [Leucobacter chromiisoli]MBK0418938.1 DUF1648 domain-containing protein [Leucobacter chromiisoli]
MTDRPDPGPMAGRSAPGDGPREPGDDPRSDGRSRGSTAASGHMQRPARTYETGAVTRWIRRVTVALSAATILAALLLYPTLPERIPTHFGISGQADAWGPRSSVFLLLGIFAALVGGLTWLSHHPRIFNYPAVVTEHNAQRMYRAGEQLIVWMNAACAAIFCGILVSVILPVNSSLFVVPGMVGMVAALAVGMVRMFRA